MNPYLFTTNKKLDLQQYLPEYIRTTDGIQLDAFLQVFEDYLNNMYEGNKSINYEYTEVQDIDQFIGSESFYIQNTSEVVDGDEPIEVWRNDAGPIAAVIQNVSDQVPEPIPELDFPLGRTFIWESEVVGDGKIGILEKIHRIINLVDGTMVPDKLMYQTANQLGYDQNTQLLNYNNFGQNPWDYFYAGDEYLASDQPDDLINERIKFMIDNLPQWYTQKVTRRGLKILLFAANIIGNVASEYTKNYSTNLKDWSNIDLAVSDTIGDGGRNVIFEDFESFLAGQQPGENRKEWYPSPHFNIWIDLNATSQAVDYEILFGESENSLSNIMHNTRPVNTVYEGLISVYTTRNQYYYNYVQWESVNERSIGVV